MGEISPLMGRSVVTGRVDVQSRPRARRQHQLYNINCHCTISHVLSNVSRPSDLTRHTSTTSATRSVEINPTFNFTSTRVRTSFRHQMRIMNYSVLLSLLIVCWIWLPIVRCGTRPSFVSDEMIATAASVVNACQTQTGVATVDIEAVRNGQWPETRQLKCYMYCLWEQFGLVDDKRELSLNGMLTFFQRIPAYRAEVQKAISECKGIAKGDNCEYAYRFNKCYAELSPRTYYLF
ncbi:uncharacterized protein LOC122536065 isoform X2 [Frieseomelitta varia]|nr:uncharacterized protein LOC122536065 isoform X2 [Frieseomelitta varia]